MSDFKSPVAREQQEATGEVPRQTTAASSCPSGVEVVRADKLKFTVLIYPDGEREVALPGVRALRVSPTGRPAFGIGESLFELQSHLGSLLARDLPPLVAAYLRAAARAIDWATLLVLVEPTTSMRQSFDEALHTVNAVLEDTGASRLPPAAYAPAVLRARVLRILERAASNWTAAGENERVAATTDSAESIAKLVGRAPDHALLQETLAAWHEKWRWQIDPTATSRRGKPKAGIVRALLTQLGIPVDSDDALRSTVRRYLKKERRMDSRVHLRTETVLGS